MKDIDSLVNEILDGKGYVLIPGVLSPNAGGRSASTRSQTRREGETARKSVNR